MRHNEPFGIRALIQAIAVFVFLLLLITFVIVPDNLSYNVDDSDKIDFDTLHKINPDIIAWIRIEGTPIDYPVLMSGDDKQEDYYLNHMLDGSVGLPACIYVQRDNKSDFSNPVTVIYGHNMADGSMFASLHNYEGGAGVNDAPYITIYIPGKKYEYRVLAVKVFDDDYILGRYDYFRDEADMEWFVSDMTNTIDKRDWITDKSDRLFENDGHYIVLSTCTNNDPEERLLVVALRDD